MRAVLLSVGFLVAAGSAQAGAYEDRRAQCLGWMVQGYPSGLEETACTAQFSLPSPFLFKCAHAQRKGYDSELQRNACRLFFEEASIATGDGYVRSN